MRLGLRLQGEDRAYEHDVLAERIEDSVELVVDGEKMQATVERKPEELVVLLDGEEHRVLVGEDGRARIDGQQLAFQITSFTPGSAPGEDELILEAEGVVHPPMPGKIVAVNVAEGDEVEAGDVLATLEAMKMQTEIEAPRAGVVLRVDIETGDAVEGNQVLAAIGDAKEPE